MFQSIINTLYRQPRSQWRTYQKFGGYFAYRHMQKAEDDMRKASARIKVLAPANDLPRLEVSFLTGKKYWHQTVFCAYSLQKHSTNAIRFVFYDDGSFTPDLLKQYQAQIPNSQFVTLSEIEARLALALPKRKYPYLHLKREVYKHIRKLTDVYAGNLGWKLMLDSDMLFMRSPQLMLQWLQNPSQPFHIIDSETSYGYSLQTMGELSGSSIKEKINVGVLGLHSSMVDFDRLEHWAKTLETNHGTSYYLEQALSAMLVGDQECTVGPSSDYIVYPTQNQVETKAGVLHHYVDVSKKWYFETAWKYFRQSLDYLWQPKTKKMV
ncbi:MAG: hypothetical protein ACKVOU_13280 [Cytophagales bacterium]